MQLTNVNDLSPQEKLDLGLKYKKCCGADTLVISLYITFAVAACVTVTFGVVGLIKSESSTFMLAIGIVGCVLTAVLISSEYLLILFSRKRAVTRAETLKQLIDAYGEPALIEWCALCRNK